MENCPHNKLSGITMIPEALEIENGEPYLVGNSCSSCGASFFPSRLVCTNCLTDKGMKRSRLGNMGWLYSYTMIRVAPKEFDPPYLVGYVVIQPENIRILAQLTGVKSLEELKTGLQMKMVMERIRGDDKGNELVGYKFKPVL